MSRVLPKPSAFLNVCNFSIVSKDIHRNRLSNHLKSPVPVRLDNPKAAAHVAVRPSVLATVKC